MLAVVKRRRTKKRLFEIKGDIPGHVIAYFKREYGDEFQIIEQDDLVDIFETDWFKNIDASTTPGESMKIYRQNKGMTQAELGKLLGNYTRQHISDMEHNRRSISKEVAKKLSSVFKVSVSRFL